MKLLITQLELKKEYRKMVGDVCNEGEGVGTHKERRGRGREGEGKGKRRRERGGRGMERATSLERLAFERPSLARHEGKVTGQWYDTSFQI